MLEELIEQGSVRKKNLVLVILSISASSNSQNTTTYQQKVTGGGKGSNGTICHNCSMVVMCLLSKEGSNTAIILFGPGYNKSLLNGDPGLRDTGKMSELGFNVNVVYFAFMPNYFFL